MGNFETSLLAKASTAAKQIAENQNKYMSKFTGKDKIEDPSKIKIEFDSQKNRAEIDFDGDGNYDMVLTQEDLNNSDPVLRDLLEQKKVIQGVDTPQAKRLNAQLDVAIKERGGNPDDVNKLEEQSLPPVSKTTDAAPVEEVVSQPKKKQEKAEDYESPIGKSMSITNSKNAKGAINGKITNVEEVDGKVASITIQSSSTGNKFTYTYDPASGKFVNKKENKYYAMTEDMQLVRDNEYEAKIGLNKKPHAPVQNTDKVAKKEGDAATAADADASLDTDGALNLEAENKAEEAKQHTKKQPEKTNNEADPPSNTIFLPNKSVYDPEIEYTSSPIKEAPKKEDKKETTENVYFTYHSNIGTGTIDAKALSETSKALTSAAKSFWSEMCAALGF